MAITVSELAMVTNTGTTISATKTLTAGSTVLVFASTVSGGGVAFSGCSDDGGNTYTERITETQSATNLETTLYVAENVASGSTTITVSGLGGYLGELHVFELVGASTSGSFDAVDSFEQAVTSVYAAQAAGITVTAGATALAFYVGDRDLTALSASGYTAGTTSSAAGGAIYFYPRWQSFPSGASGERAAGTLTTNGYTHGILVSIKEAAGGGSSTTPPPFPRFNYAILNH